MIIIIMKEHLILDAYASSIESTASYKESIVHSDYVITLSEIYLRPYI